MSPNTVPELQQKLFKQMGLVDSKPHNGRQAGRFQPSSRKTQRKAYRQQQKTNRYGGHSSASYSSVANSKKNLKKHYQSDRLPPTQKTQFDTREANSQHSESADSDESDEGDFGDSVGSPDQLGEAGDDETSVTSTDDAASKAHILPKAVQDRLAQDDAEIEAFERKLGIRKGRKNLPQSFKDDGLDELLGSVPGDVNDDEDVSRKRKSEYDDWLSSKRMRNVTQGHGASHCVEALSDMPEDDSDAQTDSQGASDEALSEFDSFNGFSSAEETQTVSYRQRENPYVPPSVQGGQIAPKYVPPSLRKAATSDSDLDVRLRKQIQGLVNRLTDSNILSIVQSAEELYQNNARGMVTQALTDVILAQVCKPESLPDQFFVLTGGFASALYKVIGSSFGSHLIRRVVQEFGNEYEAASGDDASHRKETSNLITFLTQLYVFEVLSCKIIFDYMERLLSELTELNVELLLRVCRMAGRLLRRDDPQALKHVAAVLNTSVSKVSYGNVSARSKFMIETINDLKSSKPKARGTDSAVVSEHVVRMKKRMGELKSQTRRLDGLAPLGVSLADIEGAETGGKWWLVGASVPATRQNSNRSDNGGRGSAVDISNETSDDEDMDMVLPDYPAKARAQGLTSVTQTAIFTALLSASNYEQGYRQFLNLRLKKDEQLEIARVLVQCVGSETQYNPYYSLVATQACSNNRRVRFALQDRLWKMFRGSGQSLFGEEAEAEETADALRMKDERRLSNVARFYASLVTEGVLTINILKPLDLPELSSWALSFVERFMVDFLRDCTGKGSSEDLKVEKVFGAAREFPSLAAGVHWFLRKRIRRTKVVTGSERKKLERVREKAQLAVQTGTD